jgi:hypothetical protein
VTLHGSYELRQNRLQPLPTNSIRSLPCNNERFLDRFVVYTPSTWTFTWGPQFPGVLILATEKPDRVLSMVPAHGNELVKNARSLLFWRVVISTYQSLKQFLPRRRAHSPAHRSSPLLAETMVTFQ